MGRSDSESIAAFEDRFARAQATEVVDLPWGHALLQSDFPHSHNHNRIVVTSAAEVPEILSAADDVLGGKGIRHRYITVIDELLGRQLTADFVTAGYEPEATTAMIHNGSRPEPPAHDVQVVSLKVLRPAILRDWTLDLPDATEDELNQLAGRTALYANGADVTLLAVFDGEVVASRADLYIDPLDGLAQIENLYTHPDYRWRGYGESLIREALRRGHDRSCRLSFLEADLDDWPRRWYRRLGYVETRQTHAFTRVP